MFVGVCMSNINGICRHYPELHQRPQIWPPARREDTGSLNSTFITSLPPHVLDTSVLKFVSETSFIKTSQRIFSANWGSLQGVIWLGWQISGIMAVGELQPQLEAGLWLWWWVARWAVVGAGDRGEAGHFGQWLERGITGDGGTPDCSLLIAAYTHYIILIAGCGDITDVIAVGWPSSSEWRQPSDISARPDIGGGGWPWQWHHQMWIHSHAALCNPLVKSRVRVM